MVNARLICARDAHDGDSRLSTGIEHRMASAWTSRPVDAAMVVSISASSARVRKKSVVNVAAAFGPRRTSHCTSAACRTVASGLGADRRNHMMDGHGGCEGYDRRGRDGYRKRTTQAKMTGVTSKPKLQYTGNTNNLVRVSSLSSSGNGTETLRDGINQDTPRLVSSLAAALPPPPPISKSDAEFLDELGIEFVWTTEELGIDELNNLFSQVGFPRRDPTRLEAALRNTHRSLWVRASRKSRLAKEGQLLAFGRATSDGALSATIWDVAVMPAWQRGGIGRGLVERLTKSIVEEGIPVVTLYAEPGVVGLYEKLGFEVDPVGVKGMAFQSGSRRGKGLLASI
ncbi:MAG: GNAT family N-acetyltransferase [bacterium]